jgi:hypothetical protein
MMLSLTPLEEAWSPKQKYDHHNEQQTRNESIVQQQQDIEAMNSANMYDNLVINVESFHPTRIDIVITDTNLIQHMKSLPYKEQQALATKVLLQHFNQHPMAKQQVQAQANNTFTIPPNPKPQLLPNSSTPNSSTNGSDFQQYDYGYGGSFPNSSGNPTLFQSPGNTPPMSTPNIEYFAPYPPPTQHANFLMPTDNKTFLYVILAILCFLLYERVMLIVKTS